MRQFGARSSLSLVVLGSMILLSSCATLSKQECLVGDWQAIGYNDGVAGYQSERLASHAKACEALDLESLAEIKGILFHNFSIKMMRNPCFCL